MARKEGSLGGEMRMRVNAHCATKSNYTRRNYLRACAKFDTWRKEAGLSNRMVRSDPRSAAEKWRDALQAEGYAVSTIHTSIAGIGCGLGFDMTGIAHHGTSEDKRKSLGDSERSRAARVKPRNADIVRFQEMVGGRRAAISRLKGSDFVIDESGYPCIKFTKDKGGKTQLQRISDSDVDAVRSYFERVGPDELLFQKIDKDLDLHGIRAVRARAEYLRYEKQCSEAEGRAEMRRQLWARYTDPEIGCAAYLKAKEAGDRKRMQRLQYLFEQEMAEGRYHLRGANRRVALKLGLPTSYDRLSLCAVSVFALSHWRNEISVKSYMLNDMVIEDSPYNCCSQIQENERSCG